MITVEIKLKDLFKLEFKECHYGNGISLEADVLEHDKTLGELPKVSEKLYFRVSTGPFNYGFPGATAWNNLEPALDQNFPKPTELIEKPDNYVCWRLPQHERRLWQAGFPVYFGYFIKEQPIEIELDQQTANIIKTYLD